MYLARQNKTNLFLFSVLTNQKHAYMNRTTNEGPLIHASSSTKVNK